MRWYKTKILKSKLRTVIIKGWKKITFKNKLKPLGTNEDYLSALF